MYICVCILENARTFAILVRKPLVVRAVSPNICIYIVGNVHTLVIFVRKPLVIQVI